MADGWNSLLQKDTRLIEISRFHSNPLFEFHLGEQGEYHMDGKA
jgi:hypothetical protein